MLLKKSFRQTLLKIKGRKFSVKKLAPSYNIISNTYKESFPQIHNQHYQKLIALLANTEGKKILDLGCGSAWFAHSLTENLSNFSYYGIDLSSEMLYFARKNFFGKSFAKLEKEDFMEVLDTIPENSYDVVLLIFSLKFNNSVELLKKIHKVLRKGGKLALLTETKDSGRIITNALTQLFNNNIKDIDTTIPSTFLFQDAHTLTDCLNSTGFSSSIVWTKSQNYSFCSKVDLLEWAKNTGMLAGWDQLLNIYQQNYNNELKSYLKPCLTGDFLLTKQILGSVALK